MNSATNGNQHTILLSGNSIIRNIPQRYNIIPYPIMYPAHFLSPKGVKTINKSFVNMPTPFTSDIQNDLFTFKI
jgi:hypothetical protein